MNKYHKIQSVYKRDPATKFKTFLEGDWSMPEFGYLADAQWCWTEKVDGTNIRLMWNHIDKVVTFNGKSDNAQLPGRLRLRLQELVDNGIAEKFEKAFPDVSVCCYGEGYGAGIQKGGGYGENQDYVMFDIKIGNEPGFWLPRQEVEEAAETLGLSVVPIIGTSTLHNAILLVRTGFPSTWGDFPAEGLVCRPVIELRTRYNERIITKIKTKDWPS